MQLLEDQVGSNVSSAVHAACRDSWSAGETTSVRELENQTSATSGAKLLMHQPGPRETAFNEYIHESGNYLCSCLTSLQRAIQRCMLQTRSRHQPDSGEATRQHDRID